MLNFPPHTLPEMKGPILPKLCLPTFGVGDASFLAASDLRKDLGELIGRSLSEPHPYECRQPIHKSYSSLANASTPILPNLFCNSNISTISRCPKRTTVGKLTPEERQLKINRYREKRNKRKFDRGVTYQCRKTLADRRPRIRGRFARNNDIDATFPESQQPKK